MDQCQDCGESFSRISQHWAMSSECSYPDIGELNKRRIIGLFLGDGSVLRQENGAVCDFRLGMINLDFLRWLDSEFGILSNGVTLQESAEDTAKRSKKNDWTTVVNEENYHDLYRLHMKPNPFFDELRKWYVRRSKVPSEDFKLSPETARMWYVTDGNVNIGKGIVAIGTRCPELYVEYFNNRFDVRVDKRNSIVFTTGSSGDFLRWIGGPPPGFEYKWELWNRDEYERKMKRSYKQPDQNLPRQ